MRSYVFFCVFSVLLASSVSARPRNLILITVDTLRADYLSCNGSTRVSTPSMDQLAKQGANFTRARSPVPLTLPSHASIMTGLNPPGHGIRNNGSYALAETHTTLAELLQKHNYRTAAFIASFVLDRRFGLDQGFDLYDDRTWSHASQLETPSSERDAEAVYRPFAEWLKKHESGKPFFAWIHLYDPHAPYKPPSPYENRYSTDPYAGEVAYTDEIIGKIRKDLESKNLLSNSIVAIVGDHGEGLGEHQEQTHSVLIYNSTLHVPMILFAPGAIKPGTRVDQLCRTLDLAPTLLDYLGIADTLGEGVSLRSLIEGKKTPNNLVAYSESLYPQLELGWSELHGIETRNYHFISAPRPELYDPNKDPGEHKNLIREMPEVARRMASALAEFMDTEGSKSLRPTNPTIDPETQEKLASLGYLSGGPAQPSSNSKRVDPKEKMAIWNEVQRGIHAFGNRDYPDAARTFERILSTEKHLRIVYDYLGASYIYQKKWAEAERTFRTALRQGLEWSGLRTKLGMIQHSQGNLQQAQKEFERAISMDDLNVTAYFHLGNVLRENGEFVKATSCFEKALAINPSYVFAKNALGMTYVGMKRNEDALRTFQQAVKMDPNHAPAYFNLAVSLQWQKRYTEAIETYRKFLDLSDKKEFPIEVQKASDAIRRLESINNQPR